MASDKSYERLMKYFDNLQRTIDDTRDGISKNGTRLRGMETTPPAYWKRSRMRRSSKSIVRSFYLRGVITLCGYM